MQSINNQHIPSNASFPFSSFLRSHFTCISLLPCYFADLGDLSQLEKEKQELLEQMKEVDFQTSESKVRASV